MKRRRNIIALAALAFVGVLAILILHAREPSYHGQTLSEWIFNYQTSEPLDSEHQAAEDAIKHMAPDAIPWLLKWAQASDSPLKAKVRMWLAVHPRLHIQMRHFSYYHSKAFVGFGILKHEAKPALPALVQMSYSPHFETREGALGSLLAIQPDREVFVPVLLRLGGDSNLMVRMQAGRILYVNYPKDAEAAGISAPLGQAYRQQAPGLR